MKREQQPSVERIAYSRKEAAAMLGCSEGHLINEIKRKRLRAAKSGTKVLIRASELERYLQAAEQQVARA
ncbi:MAG: Helix-turn-helix domain [Acidobacteriota bacterium]|nr:Helix-turn-helix domain [Acidobacteriota bacterium]